jgi:hypothetical protein
MAHKEKAKKMIMHTENLKASILNEGAFAAAVLALKEAKPVKAELVRIVEELTGIKPASKATVKELFRYIESHGASERRHEARAEVSRRIIPA